MKKFETFICHLLLVIFLYSLIELAYGVVGALEESPTILFPLRINFWVLVGSLIISGLAASFFPLWNIGKYLNTMDVKKINDYKRGYVIDYFALFLGFLGLLCLLGVPTASSKLIHEFLFWYGLVCVIMTICWFFIVPVYEHRTKKKILRKE